MREFLAKHYVYLILVITLIFCIIGISIVFADAPTNIPPPKEKYSEETLCVEPVEVMRKRHFDFLLDHRDATVIEGIRTTQHSLKECIDCHITANVQGEFARYSEATHFCANCHQFAAVNIDCFQCHADRPEEAIRKAIHSAHTVDNNDESEAIKKYLKLSSIEKN